MAKSFVSGALRAAKTMERERVRQNRIADREYNAALKEKERAAKDRERQLRQNSIANERERKAYEKELKAAHIESQLAEVESMNAQIHDAFDELEGLLQATVDVDDYVDLESLRKSEDTTPFDRPKLEVVLMPPKNQILPSKPIYQEPPKPKGFFGKKKKLEVATKKAKELHQTNKRKWELRVESVKAKYDLDVEAYMKAEEKRVQELAKEKKRFRRELEKHNKEIDQFISNLAYGDAEALHEYIAIVVENSIYPDYFRVSHEFSFEPASAELSMQVSIPSPATFPSIKAYKYIKTSDEIKETQLSKKEHRDRYCSAVYQIAIRSFHEVFEADRRGLIKTISLEVGTNESDPATGKSGFIAFVGASSEKDSFMEFDLSNLVPLATLKHLGAVISKDPVSLVAVDVSGVRKS